MELRRTNNTRSLAEVSPILTDRIIRSDKLDSLTAADRDFLVSRGVCVVIDLREAKTRKSTVRQDRRFDYYAMPFDVGEWAVVKRQIGNSREIYRQMPIQYMYYVDQHGVMARIMRKILTSSNAVLVMCSHGKDRTGVVMSILEFLAGVTEDVIVSDYVASSVNLFTAHGTNSSLLFYEAKPEVFRRFLGLFRRKYGDAESYLRTIGLSDTEVRKLKQKVCR